MNMDSVIPENNEVTMSDMPFAAEIDINTDVIKITMENIEKCHSAITLESSIVDDWTDGYFEKPCALLFAEDALLSLVSSKAVDGIFYCAVLKVQVNEESYYVARFFEYAAFEGFFTSVASEKITSQLGITVLAYNVYVKKDIEADAERQLSMYTNRRKNETTVNYQAFKRSIYDKKFGVNNSFVQFIEDMNKGLVDCEFVVCLVVNRQQKWEENLDNLKMQRYFICTQPKSSGWESSLLQFRSNPTRTPLIQSIYEKCDTDLNLVSQFGMISCLPNYHKWQWLNESQKIKHEQKFSNSSRRYPGSPRSRIIQAWLYRNESLDIIYDTLFNVLIHPVEVRYSKSVFKESKSSKTRSKSKSLDEIRQYFIPQSESGDEQEELYQGSPLDSHMENQMTINLNATNQDKSHDIDDIEKDVDLNIEQSTSIPDQQTYHAFTSEVSLSLYQYYCGELFRKGVLAWRTLNDKFHFVIMNAYSCETGDFLSNDFVAVSAKVYESQTLLECSCSTYATTLTSDVTHSSGCCHSRLLDEILKLQLNPEADPPAHLNIAKITSGKEYATVPVLSLPSKAGVDRFSVIADLGAEFVTLYNVPKTTKTIVKCHSTLCKLGEGSCRNVRSLHHNVALCPHLTVFQNFYMNHIQREVFGDDVQEEDFDEYDVDVPAVLPEERWKDVFDTETGLWNFSPRSPSQKKVDNDPMSDELKANIRNRDVKVTFAPKIENVSCECESGWFSDDFPEGVLDYSHTTNLYTDRCVKVSDVFDRVCLSRRCRLQWDGYEDSVFCLSTATCAGYEIGWDFVDSVMSSKQTFRGFVTCMNNKYERFGLPHGLLFMSVQTFINWFFAWASRMKIDFRQSCFWCDGKCETLACDGTKLGIGFKHTFVSPIETPCKDAESNNTLRRMDRAFLRYGDNPLNNHEIRNARACLRLLCDNILNKDPQNPVDVTNVRKHLPEKSLAAFNVMQNTGDVSIKKAYARVFKLLSFDASVDTILPLSVCREISHLLSEPQNCENFEELKSLADKLFYYNFELGHLVMSTMKDGALSSDIILLIKCCVEQVLLIHEQDVLPDPAVPIPATYNPPKYGRAYYFTEHGLQLRHMRKFDIDKGSCDKNFDDVPDLVCSKRFPQVSKKGISYLFLWFCPRHGHCLGFHIIPGAEGRKDPSASLYTHLEVAPKVILYDFACSLSEYTKNRESGFFNQTRFYHDIFHGFTHKCSPAFRCDKLLGFNTINSSICEQFNSFIQNIKTSAKLMSQSHFTFFLQFFINVWNHQKHRTFAKRRDVAMFGQQ